MKKYILFLEFTTPRHKKNNIIFFSFIEATMTPWRNGSASDSRSEGCVFESRRGQILFYYFHFGILCECLMSTSKIFFHLLHFSNLNFKLCVPKMSMRLRYIKEKMFRSVDLIRTLHIMYVHHVCKVHTSIKMLLQNRCHHIVLPLHA